MKLTDLNKVAKLQDELQALRRGMRLVNEGFCSPLTEVGVSPAARDIIESIAANDLQVQEVKIIGQLEDLGVDVPDAEDEEVPQMAGPMILEGAEAASFLAALLGGARLG